MLMVQKQPAGPVWKWVLGAQVLFAPIDRAMVRRARRAARKAAGLDDIAPESESDESDVDMTALIEEFGDALSHALIVAGVQGWKDVSLMPDGEAEGEGEELPFTPENLELVLSDPVTFDAFDAAYVLPYVTREREKNGSSALPNGTGQAETAASAIASSSATPTAGGDATNVPIVKTSRKPPQVKQPGTS